MRTVHIEIKADDNPITAPFEPARVTVHSSKHENCGREFLRKDASMEILLHPSTITQLNIPHLDKTLMVMINQASASWMLEMLS